MFKRSGRIKYREDLILYILQAIDDFDITPRLGISRWITT
jgi:hypothetical protein